jgi:hypothetical protein
MVEEKFEHWTRIQQSYPAGKIPMKKAVFTDCFHASKREATGQRLACGDKREQGWRSA